jgi:hypothetical protein
VSDPIQVGGVSFDVDQLHDLFAEFFEAAAPLPPEPDIEATLVVTAALAKAGGWQALEVTRRVQCPTCNAGSVYREAQRGCSTCEGAGQVQSTRDQVTFTRPCPECGGRPRAARTCGQCAGGFVTREEELRVRVPAETKPGQVLRLLGKGHQPDGVTCGNLHVEVLVEGASSGVGPLRVPLERAGALPARCFVCAGQREITRVPVAVRRSPAAPMVALPLCPRDRARVEHRASTLAVLRWAAMVAAVALVLPIFFALEARGPLLALAAGVAMSLLAVAVVRRAFARADARSPLHVWLDGDRRELVFPPLGAAHAEE